MPHLWVPRPSEHTGAVTSMSLDEPGATLVTVLAGVALQPPGDVVEAMVARECEGGLLATLTDLGLDRTGGITPEAIDTG